MSSPDDPTITVKAEPLDEDADPSDYLEAAAIPLGPKLITPEPPPRAEAAVMQVRVLEEVSTAPTVADPDILQRYQNSAWRSVKIALASAVILFIIIPLLSVGIYRFAAQ